MKWFLTFDWSIGLQGFGRAADLGEFIDDQWTWQDGPGNSSRCCTQHLQSVPLREGVVLVSWEDFFYTLVVSQCCCCLSLSHKAIVICCIHLSHSRFISFTNLFLWLSHHLSINFVMYLKKIIRFWGFQLFWSYNSAKNSASYLIICSEHVI